MRISRSWNAAALAGMSLALLSAAPAAAETLAGVQASRVFKVCANPEALPYSSDQPDHPGFQLDLHRALAERLDWKPAVTWLHNRMAAGRLGCGGFMARRLPNGGPAAPASGGDFATQPYLGSGFVVVLPVGSRTGFASLSEFAAHEPFRKGKVLGVSLGAPVENRIREAHIPIANFVYQEQIIEAVVSGELAAGLVARENAAWYLRRKPGSFALFELFRADPAFRWNVGIDLRQSDPALVEVLNRTLAKIGADGTLERIMSRYGIGYLPPFPEG